VTSSGYWKLPGQRVETRAGARTGALGAGATGCAACRGEGPTAGWAGRGGAGLAVVVGTVVVGTVVVGTVVVGTVVVGTVVVGTVVVGTVVAAVIREPGRTVSSGTDVGTGSERGVYPGGLGR